MSGNQPTGVPHQSDVNMGTSVYRGRYVVLSAQRARMGEGTDALLMIKVLMWAPTTMEVDRVIISIRIARLCLQWARNYTGLQTVMVRNARMLCRGRRCACVTSPLCLRLGLQLPGRLLSRGQVPPVCAAHCLGDSGPALPAARVAPTGRTRSSSRARIAHGGVTVRRSGYRASLAGIPAHVVRARCLGQRPGRDADEQGMLGDGLGHIQVPLWPTWTDLDRNSAAHGRIYAACRHPDVALSRASLHGCGNIRPLYLTDDAPSMTPRVCQWDGACYSFRTFTPRQRLRGANTAMASAPRMNYWRKAPSFARRVAIPRLRYRRSLA
jgi:hypothetical protein